MTIKGALWSCKSDRIEYKALEMMVKFTIMTEGISSDRRGELTPNAFKMADLQKTRSRITVKELRPFYRDPPHMQHPMC